MRKDPHEPTPEQIAFAEDLDVMVEELIGPEGHHDLALAALANAMAKIMSDHMDAEGVANVIHHMDTTLTCLVIEHERDKTQMAEDFAETSEMIADSAVAAAKKRPN